MKITITKTAGFCMGVKRAVELVLAAANDNKQPIYTFGPLIHNPHVLKMLKEKGVYVIDTITKKGKGTVFIRAHGVPPAVYTDLNKAGFKVIDATCPHVLKVQTIIKQYTEKGYDSIIIGDKNHPEVIGLLGYAGKTGHVIDNEDNLNKLRVFDKAIIVAQTTQDTIFFKTVIKWVNKKNPHYKIFNTICNSTEKRQAEVKSLAKSADIIIVIGGYNSGNTRRLAQIALKSGKPTFHIESESELDIKTLSLAGHIVITAGASTPNWTIQKVYSFLRNNVLK